MALTRGEKVLIGSLVTAGGLLVLSRTGHLSGLGSSMKEHLRTADDLEDHTDEMIADFYRALSRRRCKKAIDRFGALSLAIGSSLENAYHAGDSLNVDDLWSVQRKARILLIQTCLKK